MVAVLMLMGKTEGEELLGVLGLADGCVVLLPGEALEPLGMLGLPDGCVAPVLGEVWEAVGLGAVEAEGFVFSVRLLFP